MPSGIPDSKVDRGLKRLVAHSASRTAGDAYSMAHTTSGALHFGIDEARLTAVRDYQESQLFSAAKRAAFMFTVAASSNPNRVNDTIFAELRGHWSEEQIVELMGVIAMAGFLSRWNVSMATPIEDGAK